jgi:transcriptional regulator of acetoin/glycerol metabolism
MREGKMIAAPVSAKPKRRSLAELREEWLAPLEARYLAEVLDEHGGKVDAAAKAAGVNRVTFYRLMKKHGVTLKRAAQRA